MTETSSVPATSRARARESLLDLVERRPWRAFALFAAIHLALWSLLPILLNPNLPLDMIEALIYGREWQLGYDKHPPLMWWMVEAIHRIVPGDTVFYVVPQLLIVASFALVFATARRMTTPAAALVAVLIADGFHYFGFTAAKFNHNVIQLPFWALAGYAFLGALRNGHWRHWMLLGLAFGLALWSKYFAVMLMAPMALFLLLTRDGRRALATPGPYLTALVTLATLAPHLIWLVQHDFLPFAYAEARAAPPQHLIDHLARPAIFAAGQLGWAIPALVIALPLMWPRPAQRAMAADADRRIAALLAFGPSVLLLIGSLITGRFVVAMWGYPLFLFVGLWLVMAAPAAIDRVRAGRVFVAWAAITAIYALAFIVDYAVLPRFDQRMRAALFPGAQLAHRVAPPFRAATGQPLAYVIGSYWLAGNIGHYAPERPRVIIDGDLSRTPWIDPVDVRRRGAVIIWSDQDPGRIPAEYAAFAPGAALQAPFTLAPHWGRAASHFGWAIVPPAP
ncbi:MAG: glycosyltransferase family 39 protein [Xanthobacteraceae bacterium]|nr:MAG: glycosyltransferase family 39 protein [Xanthobacteraceae bacterium]